MGSVEDLEDELLKKFDKIPGDALIIRADKAEERLDGHDEWLEKHEEKLEAHQSELEKHTEELEAHQNYLSEHDKEFEKVNKHLSEHDETLEAHFKHLKTHDENLEEIEEVLEEHADILNSHTGEIKEHTNQLKVHDKALEEVNEKVDIKFKEIDGTLYNHGVRITNLESEVEDHTENIDLLTGRMEVAEDGIRTNVKEIATIQQEIVDIKSVDSTQNNRLNIVEEDVRVLKQTPRFLGYFSTNKEVEELFAEKADFAWSAESGTVWRYDEEDKIWKDTKEIVPDQTVYPSNELPLVSGEAEPGIDTDYARADHRHPSDPTKADVTDLENYVKKATTVWGQPLTGNVTGALSDVTTIKTSGIINGGDSVCTHGRTTTDDGKSGIILGNGNVHITSESPSILFYPENSKNPVSSLIATPTHLYIDTSLSIEDELSTGGRVVAGKTIYSHGKTSADDGKVGCVIGTGTLHLINESNPSIRFYAGQNTSAQQILGGTANNIYTSNKLSVGTSTYNADYSLFVQGNTYSTGRIIAGGPINTNEKTVYNDGKKGTSILDGAVVLCGDTETRPTVQFYVNNSTNLTHSIGAFPTHLYTPSA
ncbi:MAG: hypothetical protein LIP01_10690, partial [Tannerellaceae bacterium]|nr:hypothetical protein [Tannerellaceae bacterium]